MGEAPENNERRLFLLDGMALIYRAHFALIRSPRFTSRGLCTSAVFGLTQTVLDLQRTWQPTHWAMAFDTEEPTQRHLEFAEYKAKREALPEDIALQLPWVQRLMDALRIPTLRAPGYEADDIIGTLARQAAEAGYRVWMVTPDKDFDQLVGEGVCVLKPGRQGGQFEILDVPAVLAKWKIERIAQVIDVLGLMGDASDNIPGIPGIGEKTAQKLIAEFGSIDQLLAHVDRLSGSTRKKVEEHRELALLSRRLATIDVQVPHPFALDALVCRPYDEDALKQLFGELEFETLGQRIFGGGFSTSAARAAAIHEKRSQQAAAEDEPPRAFQRLADVPHDYRTAASLAERQELLAALCAQPSVAFDSETTGLDPRTAAPVGLSFAFAPRQAFYVPIPDEPGEAQRVLEEFLPFFQDPRIEKVGHNLKYDLTLLRWRGIAVEGPLLDTMLAHSLVDPEANHGLDDLARLLLGYEPIPITRLIGPADGPQRSLRDVPLAEAAEYACEDADVALQLSGLLRAQLDSLGLTRVCLEVECPLIPVLVAMEREGIRLDAEAIRDYSAVLAAEIDQLRAAVFAAAGRTFNLDSPKQLGEVLFDELKLVERPKKTATGQYSTREAELERLAGKHAIARDVLEYRNAVKLKSVYVDQLPDHIHPATGRLHTHYSQLWTATGRMQSNDPNLQTIPVRKERGREIRAAFVPRNADYAILSADYSQIELRIMAELSEDPELIDAFRRKLDIHAATAAKVFKVELPDVTREMRDRAKAVNFGILYGISAFGLQQRLNIPREEADALIAQYFERYPGVRQYIDRTIAFARQHGYVTTLLGRRRYLRDINSRNNTLRSASERLAMNSPLQGTAADLLKLAMIRIHTMLCREGLATKMLLTVHDEIVFDLLLREQEQVVPRIVECMQNALPMRVPIEVDTGIGPNWLAAH